MGIKAIIFGASGMVGEGVLIQSLKHPNVEKVLVIGRRPCGITHDKLTEIIHDNFYDYTEIKNSLSGYDACFFCLGVSSVGMNETDYRRITYDLTMQAGKALSELNPDMTFCYVSGTGTDSSEKGRIMWARIKGKTENDLSSLQFRSAYMFRPGLMKPVPGQRNIKYLYKIIGQLYPFAKMIFPAYACKLEDVGTAMIKCSSEGYEKRVLDNRDITKLAQR